MWVIDGSHYRIFHSGCMLLEDKIKEKD